MPDVPQTAADVIAAAMYEHNWASPDSPEDEPPRDETECCATAVLDALKAARYELVQLPEPDEHNEWFGTDWTVWISRGGIMQVRSPGYMSHPIKARHFAAALLAAAAVSGANK